MELRHLRYFVRVAEELNFSRAAVRLRIAQPALSRQIKDLEEELGVLLLQRTSSKVTLTDAGRVLLGDAKRILTQVEETVRRVRGTHAPILRQLNVGFIQPLFFDIMPALLRKFRALHPEITVALTHGDPVQQGRALLQGDLDVGFIGLSPESPTLRLSHAPFIRVRLSVAMPKNHPLARKRVVELQMLGKESIVPISEKTSPSAYRFMIKKFREAGIKPKLLPPADSGATMLSMVAGGMGLAILPDLYRKAMHRGVAFRPLYPPADMEFHIAWKPDRQEPALLEFIRMSRALGAEMSVQPLAEVLPSS